MVAPTPNPMLPLLLSLFLLLVLLPSSTSDFLPSDVPGPFLRRRGTTCPKFLEFMHSGASAPPPSSVTILDESCTTGELLVDNTEDVLAAYLRGFPQVGQTITYLVNEPLVCPGITFQPGALFTFIKPSSELKLDFSRAFSRNGTDVSEGGEYTVPASGEVLVVGHRCLYTRLTEEEIDQQRGECFPADANLLTRSGTRNIESIRNGEFVWDGARWTRVIGWTHRDGSHVGPFIRLLIDDGGELVLSKRHFLYTDAGLRVAASVKVGMRVSSGVVVKVGSVVKKGLYNPQTSSGDVMVNGVRCSTYTEAVEPVTAHALLAPVRFGWWAESRAMVSYLPPWLCSVGYD